MSVAYRTVGMGAAATLLATARAYLQRSSAYTIQLVRWPLGPLFTFATWRVTYAAAGRGPVGGASVSGFLVIGILGVITWTSSIWASGYAVEDERSEGTAASLFLTPASRAAVVAGYGLGSFVWFLPSFAVLALLAVATGARFDVRDPLAAAMATLTLFLASLAAGFAFSGLFILSRKANLIANVVQSPAYLLSGLMIPLSSLPGWLRPLSGVIPATQAVAALRASTLLGASRGAVAGDILHALAVSLVWFAVGLLSLRVVEHVAKHTGRLDLF